MRSCAAAPTERGAGCRRPAGWRGGAQLEVLVHPPGQVAQLAVTEQRDLAVGDPLEQVAVVGDDEQRAGPAVEHVLERGQGLDVEVVGGLVEDEHVGLGHEQPQQLQPPPLATRQVADAGLLPAAGEAEAGGQLEARHLLAAEHGERLTSSIASMTRHASIPLELAHLLGEEGDGDGLAGRRLPDVSATARR